MRVHGEKKVGRREERWRVLSIHVFFLVWAVAYLVPELGHAAPCDSDFERCAAGVELACGADPSTKGALRCELKTPLPVGDLTKFSATITWPGQEPLSVDVLSKIIDGPELKPLEFSFRPPKDLAANAIFDAQLELAWSSADLETRGQISMAHALGVDGFVAIRPAPLLPNSDLYIRVMGPNVADFEGATLRCPLAGARANPLIALNESSEVQAKTIGVRVFSAGPVWFPVGTPPLKCTLEGKLRDWPVVIPMEISIARPQGDQVLVTDRSFVAPGDEVRVLAFRRDARVGTFLPVKDVELRGFWTGASSRRKSERKATTSENGGAVLTVPDARLGTKSRFTLDWRWNSDSQTVSERVLGGLPGKRLETRFPVQVQPDILHSGQRASVEVRAHLLDGSVPPDKKFQAGFYWRGKGWTPSILFGEMLVPGDGIWKQSVGFKQTLLWELEALRVTKGIALVVGRSEEGYSTSSWATLTYGPNPVWVRWLPASEEGRDQILMSRYDGSVLDGEPTFKTVEGDIEGCRKEGDRLWSCPSVSASGGVQSFVLTEGYEGLSETTPLPAKEPSFLSGIQGSLRFLVEQVRVGEPVQIEIRKPRVRAEEGDACSSFLVLSSVDGARIGGKNAWSRCLDSDEPVQKYNLPGLARNPGLVNLRVLWFSSGGQVHEDSANLMVLPEVLPEEMVVSLQEDRRLKVELPKDKLSKAQLMLWVSDSMDPGLNDLRADHVAAAAMGVTPPEGHVLLTSGLQHPAGWLAQAIDADSDSQALELSLADGYALPVPMYKSSVARVAPVHESVSSQVQLFEKWLRDWSDRWDETRKTQDDPAACMDVFPLRSFQRNIVEDRLDLFGVLDMRISLRRGPYGVEGLNILWFGPDRSEGTQDDLGYYFGMGCGGDYNFTLSSVRAWDSQPRIDPGKLYSGGLIPHVSRKYWLSFMESVRKGTWVSPQLSPGRWWVHAVAFEQGRLKLASIREVLVSHAERPVPAERQDVPVETP